MQTPNPWKVPQSGGHSAKSSKNPSGSRTPPPPLHPVRIRLRSSPCRSEARTQRRAALRPVCAPGRARRAGKGERSGQPPPRPRTRVGRGSAARRKGRAALGRVCVRGHLSGLGSAWTRHVSWAPALPLRVPPTLHSPRRLPEWYSSFPATSRPPRRLRSC